MPASSRWLLAAVSLGAFAARADPSTVATIVETDAGSIAGAAEGNRVVFRGVPYAAPPVGDLRFAPPQPVTPWTGTLDATHFHDLEGTNPPQPNAVGCPQAVGGQEDCLYLNVYVPASAQLGAHLPVMVFLHGAGNKAQNGQVSGSDGTTLPSVGVILVTVDFRLGALGWLPFPEQPQAASNGLLDQIAALQWVQRNIAQFGGRPGQVMLFGQSAGASDTMALLASPLASGLFTRAAVESGPPYLASLGECSAGGSCTGALGHGALLERTAGCSGTSDVLACMRGKIPTLAGTTVTAASLVRASGSSAFIPVIDGLALSEPPLDTIARNGTVPLVVGSLRDEWQFFNPAVEYSNLGQTLSDADYLNGVEQVVQDESAAAHIVGAVYPPANYASDALAYVDWQSDYQCQCPARALARAAVASSARAPVFKYFYTHALANNAALQSRGAFHTQELSFVFGWRPASTIVIRTMHVTAVSASAPADPLDDSTVLAFFPYTPTPAEATLSNAIQGYWARFAATGDPNGDGAPAWPRYDPSTDRYLEIGDSIVAGDHLHTTQCDDWDRTAMLVSP